MFNLITNRNKTNREKNIFLNSRVHKRSCWSDSLEDYEKELLSASFLSFFIFLVLIFDGKK